LPHGNWYLELVNPSNRKLPDMEQVKKRQVRDECGRVPSAIE